MVSDKDKTTRRKLFAAKEATQKDAASKLPFSNTKFSKLVKNQKPGEN